MNCFGLFGPALLALACSTPLFAQYTTASLGGTVSDPSGASVPEAKVTVRNLDTGFTQSTDSAATGAFLFSRLPLGSYELRVEKTGFGAYSQSGIRLTVDQMATQNVTLSVGQVSEQVTVQAETELIATRTATGGQLVNETQIRELPLQGRRPERLVYLAAGTVDLGRNACRICGHGGVYPGQETAGVNGAGLYQVNFQLDGTSHNDTYLNSGLPFPNPDSVQEFNLQSSNFSAEYGNAAGGVVNIVTRCRYERISRFLVSFHPQRRDERASVLRAGSGYPETQSVRRRNRRPHRQAEAVLLRDISGHAFAQHAGGSNPVRSHRGTAPRRLLRSSSAPTR